VDLVEGKMMSGNGLKLLIAGGKTGGHLFPGMAIAKRFLERGPQRDVLFAGTREGIEAKLLPAQGFALATVRSSGIRGKGLSGMLRGIWLIPVALMESLRMVRSYKPHVALGVGGYVSGPVLAAVWLAGVPFAIQEQNVTPGLTNRILAHLAKKVFASFEESRKYFPAKRVVVSGNPVRPEVISVPEGKPELDLTNFKTGVTLLVFGGSQGARAINNAVVDFFRKNPEMKDSVNVIHQTGKDDFEAVRKAYFEMSYDRAVVTPFIYRMGEAYRAADLVLCRAGAGTVFELAALGKPAILVPFPYAVGDHQTYNAAALAGLGAAVMVVQKDMATGALESALKELLMKPDKLREMAGKAAGFAKPDAADEISRGLEDIAAQRK